MNFMRYFTHILVAVVLFTVAWRGIMPDNPDPFSWRTWVGWIVVWVGVFVAEERGDPW